MYDKAFYIGYFSTFESEENDGSPFTFTLNWNFKVEMIVQKIPGVVGNNGLGNPRGQNMVGVYPQFQTGNTVANTGTASAAGANAANKTVSASANAALAASAAGLASTSNSNPFGSPQQNVTPSIRRP
jgi:hypothetical protein